MKLSQKTYREWVLGTLVYMVILSLFDDYTNFVYIKSASTIFFASLVLQALTFWTLGFKKWISSKFTYAEHKKFKPAKFFTIWFVLFSSKFVFLWAIDVIFGKYVQFSGFLALMTIIIFMTIVKETLFYIDSQLKN